MSSVPPPTNPGPPTPTPSAVDPIVKDIKKQAYGSLIWGILCVTICSAVAIILGIFPLFRGLKANKMIKEHGVGQEFKAIATIGTILGGVSMVLSIVTIAIYVMVVMLT